MAHFLTFDAPLLVLFVDEQVAGRVWEERQGEKLNEGRKRVRCHENWPESIHPEDFSETRPAEQEELNIAVHWPSEHTGHRLVPQPCCVCPGSCLRGVSRISRPRRIKSQRRRKGRAECHCLRHRHYTASPPVAQQECSTLTAACKPPARSTGLAEHPERTCSGWSLCFCCKELPQVTTKTGSVGSQPGTGLPKKQLRVHCGQNDLCPGTGQTAFGTGQADRAWAEGQESTKAFWFCMSAWWVGVLLFVCFQEGFSESDTPWSF